MALFACYVLWPWPYQIAAEPSLRYPNPINHDARSNHNNLGL